MARPPWAGLTAFESPRWSADAPPNLPDSLLLLDEQPREGSEYYLQVSPPFHLSGLDDAPWLLFMPANAAQSGWEEYPEEIPCSALVQIRVSDIISQSIDTAWLRVRAERVLPIANLFDAFKSQSADLPLEIRVLPSFANSTRTTFLDYALISCNLEGDVGEWVLCQKSGSHWHLLLYGEWGFHHDFVHAGHRILKPEEWRALSREDNPT